MMAEHTPSRGKFSCPSGQVWSKYFPGLLLYSQTSLSRVLGNAELHVPGHNLLPGYA